MGLFSCIPGVDIRCWCCKGSLKVPVLFIIFLSMLFACYALILCLSPSCEDMYNPDTKGFVDALNIVKWIFFTFTLLLLVSCSVCFLAICMQNFPNRSIPADLHVVISFVWSLTALAFGVLEVMHYFKGELKCKTATSDFVIVLLFSPCSMFFTCILNSYIAQAENMK